MNVSLTGFEYFSLLFFIFFAQYSKESRIPVIPFFTFLFGVLTFAFMIAGK